jgi:hypothetical protein
MKCCSTNKAFDDVVCWCGISSSKQTATEPARRHVAIMSITPMCGAEKQRGVRAFTQFAEKINVRCVISSNLALVISYFSASNQHDMCLRVCGPERHVTAQSGAWGEGPYVASAQLQALVSAATASTAERKETFRQQQVSTPRASPRATASRQSYMALFS